MTQTNYNTLAISSTLEGINKIINQYFYSDIEVREKVNILTGNKSIFYDLFNSKGKIDSFVIIKDKRYRFLMKM